jgi:Ca-activated chloride channel family protein
MHTMRALLPVLLILPAALGAQGLVIPRCPRPMPGSELECRPAGQQIVRTRSDVKVELRDRVLRYEVEERFVNRGGMIGEADYIFPLPKNAAFRDLKLSIDGELVSGETMNATDARRIYEDIVRSQRDPALVEWMGHGMLRTRIFPIQPGEERRVVVRYESVADREGDAVRVDYFRGSNPDRGVQQQGGGLWEGNSRRPADAARTSFALTYRAGGELGEAYSPTHELDVDRDGVRRDVRIRSGGPDITVLVALRRTRDASISMLPHAVRGEPGYALITVTPPAEVAANRLPRDVTFVIDVSGSMAGKKMEQAKAAGHQLLGTLGPQDRFRVIDFSTDVRSFRDDFVLATDANVRAARRYIDDLDATGSTNISGALEEALRAESNCRSLADARDDCTSRVPIVLFMTDGAPTVGDRDPASIAARAARMRRGARVFTFGVGADLNVALIEQLALEGRGTAHFVRPNESVERAVELVASRLRQPLLTDVRVDVAGGNVRLTRLYPSGEQDVFAGQDLVLLARYSGDGPANVVVRGRSGGRDVQWSAQRNFPRDDRDNAFVPRLWATQRIGWLSAEKRKSGGSREIDEEIRQLGERFGIPTEFTSYLVLEPGMVANTLQRGRTQDMRGVPVTSGGVRGSVGSGASSVAPPPSAPEAQFERAREAAAQRSAKSLAAADVAMEERADVARRAGNRMFSRDGERWVDTRYKTELRVYKVKAYSQGYFALLEKLPDLRESLSIGDKVVVAGRAVAVEIVEDAPDLSAAEIETITRSWN